MKHKFQWGLITGMIALFNIAFCDAQTIYPSFPDYEVVVSKFFT